MATVNDFNTYPAAGTRGVSLFAQLADAFRQWNDNRATRAELQRLTDRELADIGIARDMIADVVAGRI